MFKTIIKLAVAFTFVICSTAQAHKPIFTNEKGANPESAVRIEVQIGSSRNLIFNKFRLIIQE